MGNVSDGRIAEKMTKKRQKKLRQKMTTENDEMKDEK